MIAMEENVKQMVDGALGHRGLLVEEIVKSQGLEEVMEKKLKLVQMAGIISMGQNHFTK